MSIRETLAYTEEQAEQEVRRLVQELADARAVLQSIRIQKTGLPFLLTRERKDKHG